MEVLEVSGYVSAEKMSIADRYLSPQAKEATGLKDVDITLEPGAIESLIRYYCRESGVRNLKKHIDKVSPALLCQRSTFDIAQIYRKAAFKIVTDLGETGLPEPDAPTSANSEDVRIIDNQSTGINKPASEHLPGDDSPQPGDPNAQTTVTTTPRKPLKVPDGIHVKVTKDNLRDYVGP